MKRLTDEQFYSYANMTLHASITHNNKNPCTKCDHNSSHKMSAITLICNNTDCDGKCLVEYKAYKCHKGRKYIIMKLNEHEDELEPRVFSTKRGLTPRIKLLLKKLIFDYDIGMPMKLHMKCHNKYKEKIEATKGEAMPTLTQIQDI